mgnify:CR=1 FL=1
MEQLLVTIGIIILLFFAVPFIVRTYAKRLDADDARYVNAKRLDADDARYVNDVLHHDRQRLGEIRVAMEEVDKERNGDDDDKRLADINTALDIIRNWANEQEHRGNVRIEGYLATTDKRLVEIRSALIDGMRDTITKEIEDHLARLRSLDYKETAFNWIPPGTVRYDHRGWVYVYTGSQWTMLMVRGVALKIDELDDDGLLYMEAFTLEQEERLPYKIALRRSHEVLNPPQDT